MQLTITLSGEANSEIVQNLINSLKGISLPADTEATVNPGPVKEVPAKVAAPAKRKKADKVEPEEAPERITLEAIRTLALSSNLPSAKIKALLDEVGAENLSSVPEEKRAELYAKIQAA